MSFPILPKTPAGARFVALAEAHAADFLTRASEHDRDGTFPYENIEAMKSSGFVAACVPEALGGMGVTSVHDVMVGVSRLAQGDSSTTIGISMHLMGTMAMARRWAQAPSDPRPGEAMLRRVAAGEVIFAAINSENGSDPRHPFSEGTKVEGGWLINGRKSFGTGTPAATHYSCAIMVHDAEGTKRVAVAQVPRDTAGMVIDPVWDAFGMRASGSDDIVFTDCFLPDAMVTVGQPWGTFGPNVAGATFGGIILTSVFLGIAEAAFGHALNAAMTRKRRRETPMREIPAVQAAIAELEILLAATRAMLVRTSDLVDTRLDLALPTPPLPELQQIMMDVQATKHFVNHTAIQICDKSLALSGGAGYLNKNPLSRLYRDVRAGPFMSPLTAGDGIEYIGRVALGLDPDEG